MANSIKEQQDILSKLNIHALNPMQEEAISVINDTINTILLSPTGTGKTLAFLLPVIKILDPECNDIQALILVPSRELAIQIEQVARSMGSGFKVNAVYGGRPMSKDKTEIKHVPSILIGTPGRIADHFSNDRFSKKNIKTLILDEFDKSLEIGFEMEMREIIGQLPHINKRVLTSATHNVEIPGFVRLNNPTIVNYLSEKTISKLEIKTVKLSSNNKLQALLDLIEYLGDQPGIVFCNLRESIEQVSRFLDKNNIMHSCFSGGMEQKDRERSLIKFRNGTSQILIATDLASRGIDIPELKFIVHYEMSRTLEEFTHRNGRVGRVESNGTAYVMKFENKDLPEFVKNSKVVNISKKSIRKSQLWKTLFISGGRKDKISKGDIAGLFFKQGKINKDDLGTIELKQDCAFVAVPKKLADQLVDKLNNTRLKKKKVRVTIL
jgi:superfamily II DNA/RNA helicase